MLYAVLFISYLVVFVIFFHWSVCKSLPWIKFWQSSAIFLLKIFLGCGYGYVFLKYYGGDDTWNFFQDSLPETDKLFHHTGIFFHDLLPAAAFAEAGSFSQGLAFYFRNLEYWFIVKPLAIFNIFSRGNYYTDVLFFEMMTVWGQVLLFRLLYAHFPSRKNLLLVAIFFVPPIQFWLSGIRAEAMLVLFISVILFYTEKFHFSKKASLVFWIAAGFAGFLVFRVQFLLLFLPAYISWVVTFRHNRRPGRVYLLVYALFILVFVLGLTLFPGRNLAQPLIRVQQNFMALHGNTRLPLDSLQPGVLGVLHVLPQAFRNTFLRPWITEAKGLLQILSALEIMAGWLVAVLLLFFPVRDFRSVWRNPLILMFIFYGLTQVLTIGFFVPFPGAIMRYKSIPELLLIITVALSVNWRKIYYNLI